MNAIPGLMAVTPMRAGPRRAGAGGFAVPEDAADAASPPPLPCAGLPSLLALQEVRQAAMAELGPDAVRDREAREHGEAMLDALAQLQQALLGGAAPGVIARLGQLVRRTPAPADPGLAAVQRTLLVRVAVELARSRAAASV